jgi:preprotein translocase subunit SecG
MFVFLVILILITSVLLILAVLVQNSKKEGLGNAYIGGDTGAGQLVGVKKTSDLLEQVTWGLVIALFSLTLAASLCLNKESGPGTFTSSPNIERAQDHGELRDAAEEVPPAGHSEAPPEE